MDDSFGRNRPAAFIEPSRTYLADTCTPLAAAMRRGEVRLAALARAPYPGRPLPAGILPGVRSIGFWDAGRDQSWGLLEHRNEGVELTYLERGRLGFGVGRRRYALEAGALTVTRPWQPHRVGLPRVTAGRLHWLILDVGVRRPHQPWRWPTWVALSPDDLGELTRRLRCCERPVWSAPVLGGRFERIGRLVGGEASGRAVASRLALEINGLLVDTLDLLRGQNVPEKLSLTRAERTVAMVLAEVVASLDQPWTLGRLAESAGLRRTRFAFYVRQLTGLSPVQFLIRRRLERACELLGEPKGRSITEIALDCGFSSSQYFATLYRRRYGRAPRDDVRSARRPAGRSGKPCGMGEAPTAG